MDDDKENLTLHQRRKKCPINIPNITGCFHSPRRPSTGGDGCHHHSLCPSPSRFPSWLKLKSKDDDPPVEIRRKSKIQSKMSRHRRHASDFSYDAISYSLNFQDDMRDEDEAAARNFAARMRLSSPQPTRMGRIEEARTVAPEEVAGRRESVFEVRKEESPPGTAAEERSSGGGGDVGWPDRKRMVETC